ncbi:autoinducer 2 ABC transporter substrate-binding protein [uncultured Sphaerochaeta sp.]|uniref:autoinducer 2 ABC transporter substrate-binding protein n=1 Tax=uncultured Sphaerochaeta sp. TaxID=886478 RepID=UPI002A0A3E7C|nr:autoinducer 2 ABC transporter substrate-binding protein [uncultured Sphaerochaeta sp.]
MKKFLCGLMMVLAVGSFAFAQGQKEASVTAGGKKTYKIALVPKDSTNAWFVRMKEGVDKYSKVSGNNAFQKGPAKTDAAMQVQVIQDLISQDIDALCVVPVEPKAVEPVLMQARKKGIIVICHEGSNVENCDYDIEAFNNGEYGAFIMDNLAKAMGQQGEYTTMVASVTNASHNEWADGGVARQKAAYPKMTLLAAEPRVESADNSETAYEKAKELIKKYPDLKGIMGTSSKDAPGVARAIEELGLKDKFFVSGTGMPNECRQFVKDGTLAYITLWDPADAGYACCSLAAKILSGEKIEDGVDLGLKGYDNLHFREGSKKVLIGSGWIVIGPDTIDNYNF